MGFVSAVGHMARNLRAGEKKIITHQDEFAGAPESLSLWSPAFEDMQPIPDRYTISGEDISPPLVWGNLPSGTRELVLIIEDFDVPMPNPMVHAIVYGLDPEKGGLVEGALPSRNANALDPEPQLGNNGMSEERYDGPAAFPGHGVHHYVFQLFALGHELEFDHAPTKSEIVEAMKDYVLATGKLTGTFERE